QRRGVRLLLLLGGGVGTPRIGPLLSRIDTVIRLQGIPTPRIFAADLNCEAFRGADVSARQGLGLKGHPTAVAPVTSYLLHLVSVPSTPARIRSDGLRTVIGRKWWQPTESSIWDKLTGGSNERSSLRWPAIRYPTTPSSAITNRFGTC